MEVKYPKDLPLQRVCHVCGRVVRSSDCNTTNDVATFDCWSSHQRFEIIDCENNDRVYECRNPDNRVFYSLLFMSGKIVARDLERYYVNGDYEDIKRLPRRAKDVVLFYFLLRVDHSLVPAFSKAIKALIHPNTRSIDFRLTRPDLITDEILSFFDICPRLQNVVIATFGKKPKVSREGWINFFKTKKYLSLAYLIDCSSIDNSVLSCIAKNCPALKFLYIGYFISEHSIKIKPITYYGIRKFFVLNNLEVLGISKVKLRKKQITAVLENHNLQALILNRCCSCKVIRASIPQLEEKGISKYGFIEGRVPMLL